MSPDIRLAFCGPPNAILKGLCSVTSREKYKQDTSCICVELKPAILVSYVYLKNWLKDKHLYAYRDWGFSSLCEHHFLPFIGTATVGYVPNNKVIGLSKIPRLVNVFAKRPQVQERMTNQIAEALMRCLSPLGVGVMIKAHHACMGCRGVLQPDAEMVTSAMLGCLREDASARNELLSLM
jgi:GTP cyclohydrolase I